MGQLIPQVGPSRLASNNVFRFKYGNGPVGKAFGGFFPLKHEATGSSRRYELGFEPVTYSRFSNLCISCGPFYCSVVVSRQRVINILNIIGDTQGFVASLLIALPPDVMTDHLQVNGFYILTFGLAETFVCTNLDLAQVSNQFVGIRITD